MVVPPSVEEDELPLLPRHHAVELANLLLPTTAFETGIIIPGSEVVLEASTAVTDLLLEDATSLGAKHQQMQIQAVVNLEKLSEIVGVSEQEFVSDLRHRVDEHLHGAAEEEQETNGVEEEEAPATEEDALLPAQVRRSSRVPIESDAFARTCASIMVDEETKADDDEEEEEEGDTTILSSLVPDQDRHFMHDAFLLEMPGTADEQHQFVLALPETSHDDVSEMSDRSFLLRRLSMMIGQELPTDVQDIQIQAGTTDATDGKEKQLHLDVVVKRRVPLIGYVILITGLFALASVGAALDLQGHDVSPNLKSFWRGSATTIVFAPLALRSLRRDGVPKHDRVKLALFFVSSVSYAFAVSAFVTAIEYTTLTDAFVLSNLAPLMIILGRFAVRLPILITEGLGARIGFFGGAICAFDANVSAVGSPSMVVHPQAMIGNVIAVFASAATVGFLLTAKKLRSDVDLFVFMFFIFLMSSIYILVYMLFLGEPLSFSNDRTSGLWGWTNLTADRLPLEIYVAVVCNLIGWAGYIAVMKYFEPIVVSTVMLMEPVLGGLMGVVAGVDPFPGLQTWIGNCIVSIGIILVIWSGSRKTESIDATEALRITHSTDEETSALMMNIPVYKSPHHSRPRRTKR